MSNYSLSVCLTDLEGAQVQANQNGEQFLFIPIQRGDLFLSEKGKVYLNLSMWAKRSGADQYGKTHGIKQSLSQAKKQAIGEEAAKNIPFIGSAKEIVSKNQQSQQGGYQQPQQQPVYQQTAPQGYAAPQYPQNPAPSNNPFGNDSSMPF